MGTRIAFQGVLTLALLFVLVSDGSYAGTYAWLGDVTPIAVVNLAAQYALVLVTVQVSAFIVFFAVGLAETYIQEVLDGPVFRLAHARQSGSGRHRARHLLLSERALSILTALRSANENSRQRIQSIVLPLSRWGSATSLILTALVMLAVEWPLVRTSATDLANGAVGQYVATNLELVIAVVAFLLSLTPYVVLLVLLFSSSGRRARLRNNSQIVTDATLHLAQLDLRITRVSDIAYQARSHLIETREARVIRAVARASGSRLTWYDGSHPFWLEESADVRMHRPDQRADEPTDQLLQKELRRAIKGVRRKLKEIEQLGLAQTCAAATGPIAHRLRTFQVSFWPSRTLLNLPGRNTLRTGALETLSWTIPSLTDTASDRLRQDLERRIRIFTDERHRLVEDSEDVRERPSRMPHRAVRLANLSEDEEEEFVYLELLQQAERHIQVYCQLMDKTLIQDGARNDSLWRVSVFLNRHVLGGRIDTLAERRS